MGRRCHGDHFDERPSFQRPKNETIHFHLAGDEEEAFIGSMS
jgi:hypothetical protein